MSCEFILFDESLRDRFIEFAAALGIPVRMHADSMEGWIVEVPDELDDVHLNALETEYDELQSRQRELIFAEEGSQARDLMGVNIDLPGGEPCLVRLPAAYGRRLAEHFTFEEIRDLVTLIADGVLNPTSGPICHRP